MVSDWKPIAAQLLRTRRGALVGYAYVLTSDLHQAEDLVHEAMVVTFSKPRNIGSVGHAEGYVRKAITTAFLNSRRSHKTFVDRMHLVATPAHVDDHATHADATETIRVALNHLSPRERACVVLRFYEHMTVPEIADTVGLAPGSVKRYLSDGLRRLEPHLGSLHNHVTEAS